MILFPSKTCILIYSLYVTYILRKICSITHICHFVVWSYLSKNCRHSHPKILFRKLFVRILLQCNCISVLCVLVYFCGSPSLCREFVIPLPLSTSRNVLLSCLFLIICCIHILFYGTKGVGSQIIVDFWKQKILFMPRFVSEWITCVKVFAKIFVLLL